MSLENEKLLDDIVIAFDLIEAKKVKEIERVKLHSFHFFHPFRVCFFPVTNHDVKAVEYYLKQKLHTSLLPPNLVNFVHFACTSEDVNNLAYALMIRGDVHGVVVPRLRRVLEVICV